MGLQIIGYDEDENPQYGWVDDPVDQFTPNWNADDLSTPGQGGGDMPTFNVYPDGYGGYVDGDGNPVTVTKNENGEFVTGGGQVLPKTDALGGEFKESTAGGTPSNWTAGQISKIPGGSGFINSVKGFFQKKDANGKVLTDADGNPLYDWSKIIAAGTAAASLSNLNKPNRPPTGYQGGIPSLQAIRSQIPGTYDPNRRPGSGGQRYFSDMAYVNPSDTEATQAAKQRIAQGASDIVAANRENPAYEARKDIVRTAPASTGMLSMPSPSKPASGIAGVLSPDMMRKKYAGQNAITDKTNMPEESFEPWQRTPQEAAQGGLMGMAKGRYLRGDTDGMADKLNTSIDNTQPAKLSHGEFVIPADVVSHLGNGNSDAGAKKLYSMMDKIRMARTGTKKQGKEINPDKFMPGGLASLPNKVKGFDGTTGSAVRNVGANVAAGVTGTESNLSNWAGPYVTGMLGKAEALGNKPYEEYQGPLTAGASGLQKEAFQGGMNLNVPTQNMGGFTPQTFGAEQAQQYMNPYLQSALQPQLEEQRRQAQINLQPSLSKLTQAGGFGGGRQAIMQSEANRNLQAQQNQTIGQGYMDAYNKAMDQFNKEQGLGLQAQQATNTYGLQALQQQAALGAQQRGIESEGISADIAQFEQEKLDPYKKLQFQQSMLQGMPVQAQQYNAADQSTLQKIISSGGDTAAIVKQLQDMGVIPKS